MHSLSLTLEISIKYRSYKLKDFNKNGIFKNCNNKAAIN